MKRLALSIAATLLATHAAAQVPAGPEFPINEYTTGLQWQSQVSMAPDGGFVVVWEGNFPQGDLREIVGRRFDPFGLPRGSDFLINTQTPWDQVHPRVSVGRQGDFVVTWVGDAIFARRFDSSANPQGDQFQVNEVTTTLQWDPTVGMAPNGGFVVVWSTDGVFGGLGARLFTHDGLPRGEQFVVSPDGKGPSLAVMTDGSFVIVWTGYDSLDIGLKARRYDRNGAPLGPEFQVNSYEPFMQFRSSVAAAPDGSLVVAWNDDRRDGSSMGVFARRFDGSGTPRGADFAVNAYTTGSQLYPNVTVDGDGDYVVTWENIEEGSAQGVYARRFNASGSPLGAEFRINTYTTGRQSFVRSSSDANGNLVAAWSSEGGQDGSNSGIFGQRFGGLRSTALAADAGGNGVLEPGETALVAPSWRNVSGTPQAIRGQVTGFGGPGTPGNPGYIVLDGAADYGILENGAIGSCAATSDCFSLSITVPDTRPAHHWDALLREDIEPLVFGLSQSGLMHVGDSFTDVPRSSPYYRFTETLLHSGVTAGCGGTQFCPGSSTTREQIAVLVLRSREGPLFTPRACAAPVFDDVLPSSPFCPWIEELTRRGIVSGCGGGLYCPSAPVTREQIAVLALATKEGAGYSPPPCTTPIFADVPASSPFCRWIEELARRGVVSGCGGGNYCPAAAVTREQTSAFLCVTFGLQLYAP